MEAKDAENAALRREPGAVWNLRAEAERLARSECVFSSEDEHRQTAAAATAPCMSATSATTASSAIRQPCAASITSA